MINYSPKISADISAELIAAVVDNNKAISSAVEARTTRLLHMQV